MILDHILSVCEGNDVGSGCLINALSDDYDYLITAKHLIEKSKPEDVQITGIWLDENKDINRKNITIQEYAFFIHENKDVDAAIIKINKGFVDNNLQVSSCCSNDELLLCGFPKTRKDNQEPYKTFEIKVLNDKLHGYYEAQVKGNIAPIREDIIGFSGGGLFKSHNLIAIQSKMSAKDVDETHGRIDIVPMKLYREIIIKEKLAPILPDYLKCFSIYKNDIFPFDECWSPNNVEYTRSVLRNLTDKIVESGINPYLIQDKFNTRLLVKGQTEEVLTNRLLWESWLEFLIIHFIISKHEVDIEEIFKNKRLLFSNTDKPWNTIIKNIIESDFIGLKKKGCVIISTPHKPKQTILSGVIIKNITRIPGIGEGSFMIDEGIDNPLIDFKIIHLHAFSNDCIVEKHEEYTDYTFLNKDELIEKLEVEYGKIFEQ